MVTEIAWRQQIRLDQNTITNQYDITITEAFSTSDTSSLEFTKLCLHGLRLITTILENADEFAISQSSNSIAGVK